MKAKKILSLILLLSFALPCLSGCSLKKNPSAVYDRNGNVMGYVTSLEEGVCETENEEYIPYIDIVKKEAVETLSLNGYTEEEAEKALLSEGFDISTCFDPSVFSALKAAADKVKSFICVELSMGQMIEDVKLYTECKRPVSLCNRCGGMIPSPDEVLEAIRKAQKGEC